MKGKKVKIIYTLKDHTCSVTLFKEDVDWFVAKLKEKYPDVKIEVHEES